MASGGRSKSNAWDSTHGGRSHLPGPSSNAPAQYQGGQASDRIFDPSVVSSAQTDSLYPSSGQAPDQGDSSLPSGAPQEDSNADTARRAAHRGYTQKSRQKVNALYNELLTVLPPLPPNHATPRSKAGILDYAIEHAQLLRSSMIALEMKVALSTPEELGLWFSSYTAGACTIREVAQPILDLFCIGMGWSGAEGWSLDSDSSSSMAFFKQSWTHIPSSESLEYRRQGQRNGTEVLSKYELAAARNEQGERDSLLESFFTTGSNLLIPASRASFLSAVQSSGSPSYITAPVQSAAQNPSDQLLARITLATNGNLKCAAARVSTIFTVPLCMYGRVQMLLVFYGTEPMKYDNTLDDMYSGAAEETARRIAEITLARYSLPGSTSG